MPGPIDPRGLEGDRMAAAERAAQAVQPVPAAG
jgi:hypothetical protein